MQKPKNTKLRSGIELIPEKLRSSLAERSQRPIFRSPTRREGDLGFCRGERKQRRRREREGGEEEEGERERFGLGDWDRPERPIGPKRDKNTK